MNPAERQRYESQIGAEHRVTAQLFGELLDRIERRDTTVETQRRTIEVLQQTVNAYENRLPDMEVDPRKVRSPARELVDAEHIAIDWCNQAGWATGHGDTLPAILSEMRAQHLETTPEDGT